MCPFPLFPQTTPALEAVWHLVRSVVPRFDDDRFMSPDIEKCAQLVREGAVWEAVREHIDKQFHQLPETHKRD